MDTGRPPDEGWLQASAGTWCNRWEVLTHRITSGRAGWVTDAMEHLHSGDVAFQAMGIGPNPAARLREAGWCVWDVACARRAFRTDDETAAQAAQHPPSWWAARGWWKHAGWDSCSPRPALITPDEAAALAEQGIDGHTESERRRSALIAARDDPRPSDPNERTPAHREGQQP